MLTNINTTIHNPVFVTGIDHGYPDEKGGSDMKKNRNVFTTTLRLNLKNSQDQEAWDNLMLADDSLPQYSSYTRTIVTAINDHFSRLNHPEDHDSETALLKKVENTIRRTITDCLREIPGQPAATAVSVSDTTEDNTPADENVEAVEAFSDWF